MERVLRLVIFIIIVFIIIKSSTFGWRFWSSSFPDNQKSNGPLAERLKNHVYKLAHQIGQRNIFDYEKLNESAQYITQVFESFGYTVEFQEYTTWDKKAKNIIATKKGTTRSDQIIILGAHYDSCFNPGADDNASSMGGLLELARLFSSKQTNRTIKFIAFVNEEPPFFKSEDMGSRVYAKQARERKEDIKAVIILEMIGYYSDEPFSQRYPLIFGLFYPNRANFIAVVGNFRSRRLVRKVVLNFKKHSRFPIESVATFDFVQGVDFSDHWSFWQEGFPAVMITDTAFYRYPHYHSNNDTYEKLNYKSMSEVVRALGMLLWELSGVEGAD